MLTVLIADDEKPARDKLKLQLSYCDEVELIGEAQDGQSAIELINTLKPDVVLLDIKMPYLNGMEILDVIGHQCQIIFTTAYDNYAIKAFEKAAVDYLLKPFSLQRLKLALARITISTQNKSEETLEKDKPLSSRVGNKTRLLALSDISVITSEHTQITAYLKNVGYPLDYSLDELEARLPMCFVRVHRGCISNINHIREIQRWLNGNLLLKFQHNEIEITTSRTGTAKMKKLIDI